MSFHKVCNAIRRERAGKYLHYDSIQNGLLGIKEGRDGISFGSYLLCISYYDP